MAPMDPPLDPPLVRYYNRASEESLNKDLGLAASFIFEHAGNLSQQTIQTYTTCASYVRKLPINFSSCNWNTKVMCLTILYKIAKEKLNDGKQHLRLLKLLAGLIAILLPHKWFKIKDSFFLTNATFQGGFEIKQSSILFWGMKLIDTLSYFWDG